MKTFQKILAVFGVAAVLFAGGAAVVSQPAFAATTKEEVCEAIGSKADCSGNKGGNLSDIVKTVINVLSIMVGFVAIIMIVWSGFKYVTSGGDSSKITSAKNALIYALIGLAIAALAQFMVRVVLQQADTITVNGRHMATITLK